MRYLLLLVVLLIPIGFYIYHWLGQLFRAVRGAAHARADKTARAVKAVLALLLSAATLNILSMTGVALLHFWIVSALLEGVARVAGKLRKTPPAGPDARRVLRLFLVPVLVVAGMMGYGAYNMSHVVKTAYTVRTDGQIREEGYRILLLTDIHYGSMQRTDVTRAALAEAGAVNPDLVILGGDIVEEGTSAEELQEVFGLLGEIESRFGTYFVYGNHDRQPYTDSRTYTDRQLEEAITANGIRILENECVAVGEELLLVGRGDCAWGNVRQRPSVEELIGDAGTERLVIVLDHQPVEAGENGAAGADIQLSGHTHAGQIWPTGVLNGLMGTLNYGEYEVNGNRVFVSSGLAGWRYPVRTGKHCEYVVLDILPEAGEGAGEK